MPVVRLYRHGLTAGVAPSVKPKPTHRRGDVQGWSANATRSNTRFLYSVDERKLTGTGLAVSLTLRDCPPSHEDWQRLRMAFFKRLRRLGLIRAHWLTEWQRRGVPHLHGALWFGSESPMPIMSVASAWLDVAAPFGAAPRGQHLRLITDAVGWFQYLSKHAVRGLSHYQRSNDNRPHGWDKTGRMWGHIGDWPTREPAPLRLDNPGFWALRRLARRWRLSRVRDSGNGRVIRNARAMLKCPDPHRTTSAVRGLSEWIPQHVSDHIILWLAASGHRVEG